MMPILLGIGPGDEVILPSFTFPSTANAFTLRGSKLRFADNDEFGNISISEVDRLLNKRTRAVVAVHYAGTSADMDPLLSLCREAGIFLVEDAAQALGAEYRGHPLGTLGTLGCYSFHETKNVSSGEGGALICGDVSHVTRAEVLREKGTNRSAFLQGLVDKYSWVDIGSNYVLSELNSAYLLPQLQHFPIIQDRRKEIWEGYARGLQEHIAAKGGRALGTPAFNKANYHMFALIFAVPEHRDLFIRGMREAGIVCPFHYVPLHTSLFGRTFYENAPDTLPNCDDISQCLVRLPVFYNLSDAEHARVVQNAKKLIQRF
jgi:dTDP-4-amino-4,6-dideoxygalactose transaminase